MIQLIECPRDAMQGIPEFIPTDTKVDYLNTLLRVGFHTLDFGSFVSPKAIPQMRDTREVLARLDLSATDTRLLAIVANERGAVDACSFQEIRYIGFPFSVSETFQQRNTNSSIEQSLAAVADMQDLCVRSGKELVVYLSMAFGNPYGDPWEPEVVAQWAHRLAALGINILSLADTVGVANPAIIRQLFEAVIPAYPHITWGAHLHTTPYTWLEKMEAAWEAGCRRFDGALKGFGGCPMATDTLTGNMATENIVRFLDEKGIATGLNGAMLTQATAKADKVFLH